MQSSNDTFSPIADLEHVDASYEWDLGSCPTRGGLVDQARSAQLQAMFADYQSTLHFQGRGGFGELTAKNYSAYQLHYHTQPAVPNMSERCLQKTRQNT